MDAVGDCWHGANLFMQICSTSSQVPITNRHALACRPAINPRPRPAALSSKSNACRQAGHRVAAHGATPSTCAQSGHCCIALLAAGIALAAGSCSRLVTREHSVNQVLIAAPTQCKPTRCFLQHRCAAALFQCQHTAKTILRQSIARKCGANHHSSLIFGQIQPNYLAHFLLLDLDRKASS